MGKYSVRGWQYWPDRREGQYISQELNISPYCPTQGSAVIDMTLSCVPKCSRRRKKRGKKSECFWSQTQLDVLTTRLARRSKRFYSRNYAVTKMQDAMQYRFCASKLFS